MRIRFLAVAPALAAACSLAVLSLTPAVPAAAGTARPAASIRPDSIPPDCTVTSQQNVGISMTCTDRPVGQHWHEAVICFAFGVRHYNGNEVTGDGTSAVPCPYPDPNGAEFVSP